MAELNKSQPLPESFKPSTTHMIEMRVVHGRPAPISRLPQEILTEIFRWLVLGCYAFRTRWPGAAEPEHGAYSDPTFWTRVSEVSRYWRMVILSSPVLWSYVLPSPKRPQYFPTCLVRSRNAALHVYAVSPEIFKEILRHFDRVKELKLCIRDKDEQDVELMKLLEPSEDSPMRRALQMDRLSIDDGWTSGAITQKLLQSSYMPNLQVLYIQNHRLVRNSQNIFGLGEIPDGSDVLKGFWKYLKQMTMSSDSMRYLQLTTSTEGYGRANIKSMSTTCLSEVFDVLACFPKLETLSLSRCLLQAVTADSDHKIHPIVTFPHLRSLTVEEDPEVLSILMSHFKFPTTTRIRLTGTLTTPSLDEAYDDYEAEEYDCWRADTDNTLSLISTILSSNTQFIDCEIPPPVLTAVITNGLDVDLYHTSPSSEEIQRGVVKEWIWSHRPWISIEFPFWPEEEPILVDDGFYSRVVTTLGLSSSLQTLVIDTPRFADDGGFVILEPGVMLDGVVRAGIQFPALKVLHIDCPSDELMMDSLATLIRTDDNFPNIQSISVNIRFGFNEPIRSDIWRSSCRSSWAKIINSLKHRNDRCGGGPDGPRRMDQLTIKSININKQDPSIPSDILENLGSLVGGLIWQDEKATEAELRQLEELDGQDERSMFSSKEDRMGSCIYGYPWVLRCSQSEKVNRV